LPEKSGDLLLHICYDFTMTVTFINRAHRFFGELQRNSFPNAQSLSDMCGCSRNTSQRTIYRLRDEYLVPFDYDATQKGYFLKDKNYQLPQLLPAGKDELTALLLARDMVKALDARDVQDSLDRLWHQIATNSRNVSLELEPIAKIFSSNLTAIGKLADDGILQYVLAAARGENVAISYTSPWRSTESKHYRGRILHVHFSDGNLYLNFHDAGGREIILNASFVDSFDIIQDELALKPVSGPHAPTTENWLEGFGIWSGGETEVVEIRIAAPASKYFAKQLWHEDQFDQWADNEVLVRRMPAIVSPELVRRILSIGRHVIGVEPAGLREMVKEEVEVLGGRFLG